MRSSHLGDMSHTPFWQPKCLKYILTKFKNPLNISWKFQLNFFNRSLDIANVFLTAWQHKVSYDVVQYHRQHFQKVLMPLALREILQKHHPDNLDAYIVVWFSLLFPKHSLTDLI